MRTIYVIRTLDLLGTFKDFIQYGRDRFYQVEEEALQVFEGIKPSKTYIDILLKIQLEDDVEDEEWTEYYRSYKLIAKK